jgi:hypothetical protein
VRREEEEAEKREKVRKFICNYIYIIFAFSIFFLDYLGIYLEYLVIVFSKCMIFKIFSFSFNKLFFIT